MQIILSVWRAFVREVRGLLHKSGAEAEIYFPANFEKEARVGCRIPLPGHANRRDTEKFRRELRAYEAASELVRGPDGSWILSIHFPMVRSENGAITPLPELLWEIETWVHQNFKMGATTQVLPSEKSVRHRLSLVR